MSSRRLNPPVRSRSARRGARRDQADGLDPSFPRQRPLRAPLGAPTPFRQFAYTVNITQQASLVDTAGALTFVYSQLTNATGFSDLWDQYRVKYLEFNFTPLINTFGTVGALAGTLYTVVDKDDSVTPSSITVVREYSSVQTHVHEPFTVRFRPGILTGAYNGTAVTGAVSADPPWIDCAVNNIPHYGMKYVLTGGAVGQTLLQVFKCDVYVGIEFRNTH